jgi:hypothetical protein
MGFCLGKFNQSFKFLKSKRNHNATLIIFKKILVVKSVYNIPLPTFEFVPTTIL